MFVGDHGRVRSDILTVYLYSYRTQRPTGPAPEPFTAPPRYVCEQNDNENKNAINANLAECGGKSSVWSSHQAAELRL